MGEAVIERLQGARLDHYWSAIEVELDRVPDIWMPWWTKESLRSMTDAGAFQVWAIGDDKAITVVVFTQILIYPASSIAQAFLAFGNGLDDVLPNIVATLERFAMANGCSRAEVVGRQGWARKLRTAGYNNEAIYLRKTLPNMRTH